MTSDLPLVIQKMLQPQFYPHPVVEPIQLIQTHISFVILTGDYAYKVKKSVKFGHWLDYSTLEKRYHFCQEELRLNQRTAPDIYLEVLPIYQTAQGVELHTCNSEEIIEYTLKMQQFSQNCLFTDLLENDKLTEKHLEFLGKELAKFHQKAGVNESILKFGEIAQIKAGIEENYQQTQKYIGNLQPLDHAQEIKTYTDSFFNDKSEIFINRIKKSKIRECHGDLHLKNIAWYQDQAILFDCIEFNQEFRNVDVMYDVAFTVMDLQFRQQENLANIFLNTYLEQTGDWEGLQVLPLYLCRQAYVRAKVNSLISDDLTVTESQREQAARTAMEYYQLAWEYTQLLRLRSGQGSSGRLILMSGLSGSGKSTVARYLAHHLGAIHIRSDAVRKHLAQVPLYERGDTSIYQPKMTQKTYNRLLELGILLANQGYSVILDAKYDQQVFRDKVIALAQSLELPLQIFYCTAPIHVLRKRLQQRKGDIADATEQILFSQQIKAEPFTEAEQPYVKTIDTTQGLEQQLWKEWL